jgi:hypothetical protein
MPQRIPAERVRWSVRICTATELGATADPFGSTPPKFTRTGIANLFFQLLGRYACGFINATEYPVSLRFLKLNSKDEAKSSEPDPGTIPFLQRTSWSAWLTAGFDTSMLASMTVGTAGGTFSPPSVGWYLIEAKIAATGGDGPTFWVGTMEVV